MKILTKVLMLGVIILVMVNCKKDETKPGLTGEWEGTFILDTSVFAFYFNIEQTGSKLEGSFVFTNGSSYSEFAKGSKVNDDEVIIKFNIFDSSYDPPITLYHRFEGYINDDYDEMSGFYTIIISGYSYIIAGDWSATKSSSKSTRSSGEYLKTGKGILENIMKELK
jgi:hypothetical protein